MSRRNSEGCTLFTSVTEPNHPFNQIGILRKELKRIEQHSKRNLHSITEQKVQNLLREHTEMLMKEDTDSPSSGEQLEKQVRLVDSLQLQSTEAANKPIEAESTMQEEVNRILRNANLTPFEMRELAAAYLESREPSFKTGFSFLKQRLHRKEKKGEMSFSLM